MKGRLLLLCILAGCANDPDLVRNGGFEEDAHWFWFEGSESWVAPFGYNESLVRSGQRALQTQLVSNSSHGATAIVGAIQEVPAGRNAGSIPLQLSGWYHVAHWASDAERTYLQAVISFFPEPGASDWCPGLQPEHPCQIAFILAGLDERPFAIANRIFVLPADDRVEQGEWVRFDYDVRALMAQAWGVDRLDYEHMWVYLEARYETTGPRDVRLDVLWDDVAMR